MKKSLNRDSLIYLNQNSPDIGFELDGSASPVVLDETHIPSLLTLTHLIHILEWVPASEILTCATGHSYMY